MLTNRDFKRNNICSPGSLVTVASENVYKDL